MRISVQGILLSPSSFPVWTLLSSSIVLRASQAAFVCGEVDLEQWTSPSHTTVGYHVLCVQRTGETSCSGEDQSEDGSCAATMGGDALDVTVFWAGRQDAKEQLIVNRPNSLLELEEALTDRKPVSNLERRKRIKAALEKKGKWKGMFGFFHVEPSSDNAPERLTSAQDPRLSGVVLAFEGGQFVWPGVSKGFTRKVQLAPPGADPITLDMVTQSLSPLVLEVSGFLDQAECQHVIEKAKPHVAKSKVSHMDHDVGKADTNWRSSSTFFMPSDDEITRRLDKRVGALTNTKVNQQEYSQILLYNVGERYAAHHDYFDVRMYQKNEMVQSMTKKGLFNRMATVFFYLTTVEEGGHTAFPRAGGLPQPADFEDCSRGISVAPKQGRIIIFYSMNPAGKEDEYSLHGGCAVVNGTKWSANKWIWNQPMSFLK